MSLEENKTLVSRLYEVFNNRNMDELEELMVPDYVDNDAVPGQAQGLEGYKQISAFLIGAFPDVMGTIEDMIAEGDRVVVRSTWIGTHKGDFMEIAATGKKITMTAINIYRIENGKIVEEWSGNRRSSTPALDQLKG